MKIFKYIILIVFFIFSSLEAQIIHSVDFSKSEYSYKQITAKDNNNYIKISQEDLVNTNKVGAPSLPVKYVKLIIPAQKDVYKIDFTYNIKSKVILTEKIYPAQPDIPTAIITDEPAFVEPDSKIYNL